MAIEIDFKVSPAHLLPKIERLFDLSAKKILDIERRWGSRNGTPVFTKSGLYTSQGWTEWTQGFRFGSAILQFEVGGEKRFLDIGRSGTITQMALHLSHQGVHDHGFNIVSTYGNLLRLMREGMICENEFEAKFYQLAIKVSGATQAARWSQTANGEGFIYSFNGPHSLFIDTIRSLRVLAMAHQLGHILMGEGDRRISLLKRLIEHARMTARFNVFYGEGRDAFDVRGRTAHESIFNTKNGQYRCPNSQQGYSPFSTWMRGLAWAICGFSEQLEFVKTLKSSALDELGETKSIEEMMLKAALATADFYLENVCKDGIPMWDSGAPRLMKMGEYLERDSEPFNEFEPVDSSAAAIAAQGLIRLGRFLSIQKCELKNAESNLSQRYVQSGFCIAKTLFSEPYLSSNENHEGLILHSIYHRPNGWDFIPKGRQIPCGESSMWGDYHARELAMMILREANQKPHYHFFDGLSIDK